MLKQLTLSTLKDLDFGRPAVAFEQAVADAVRDCKDRPGDNRPRRVTLDFTLIPLIDETGDCNDVQGDFRIKLSCPNRQTKPYQFGLNRNGQLYFSENCPENPDQKSMFDTDPVTGQPYMGEPDESAE